MLKENFSKINQSIIDFLKKSKIGICGYGKSGESTYKFLVEKLQIPSSQILIWDDSFQLRVEMKNSLANHPKNLLTDDEEKWSKIDILILSPGVPTSFPKPHKIFSIAKKNNIFISSDVEIFYLLCIDKNPNVKFISITGTNGKSTTTALIFHILKENGYNYEIGGNFGIPVFDLPIDSDGYVLELSSFQLDLLNFYHSNYSILLNITKDHIDRHGNMEEYIKAKSKIFMNQTENDFAIISADNDYCKDLSKRFKNDFLKSKLMNISTSENHVIDKNAIIFTENKIIDNFSNQEFTISENNYLKGRHNRENMAAAYSVCKLLNLDSQKIINSIKTYEGLSDRMEFVGNIGNIFFYNDSKATNAEATLPAITSMKNIFWIAGGISKEGGIDILLDQLQNIEQIFLFGKCKEEFYNSVVNSQKFSKNNIHICDNLEESLSIAYEKALEFFSKNSCNINILLSPAASSLDQYKNYHERGLDFKNIFNKLKIGF